jgi:polysaccharide chain length determinant protein (PEP-CTERM system associated)
MVEKETGFRDYLAIILRRKWHFLLPLIIVVSLACVFTLMLPKVYMSTATVLVKRRGVNPNKKVFEFSGGVSKANFAAIRTLIKSTSWIEDIIKSLELDKDISNPQEYNRLIEKIRTGLNIRSSGPNIFKVIFYGSDPWLAMQIVNTVCGFFVEQQAESLYQSDDKSFAVLNELLDYYEKRVDEARGVLTKFEIEHRGQMPGSLNKNFAELEKYQIKLANLELKVKEIQRKKAKVETQLSGEIDDSLETIMNEEENLTPLEKELKDLNAERDSLLVLYTPKHPRIVKINSEIETVKRKLIESYRMSEVGQDTEDAINVRKVALNPVYLKLRSYQNSLDEQLKALATEREEIKRKIVEYEKRVKDAPNSEQEYAMLQRDFNVNDNIYKSLLARLEDIKIEKEFSMIEQGNKFEVITPAQVAVKPVSPKMSKNIIVGSILGIIFGVCVTFWAEYTDHTIRESDGIQAILNVPLLVTIPTVLTEEEIIKKRRLNMFLFVMGSFYTVFIILLIIRELILAYVPSLLYLQTYKSLVHKLLNLVGIT